MGDVNLRKDWEREVFWEMFLFYVREKEFKLVLGIGILVDINNK